MSELADALEIMHSVAGRFQSVRATIREWRDPELDEESRDRLRAREGERVRARPWPRPSPMETRVRLWFRPPDRWRMDREMPEWMGGSSTMVVNGPEVWTSSEQEGVFTNLGRPDGGTVPGPEMYLIPAEVIARIQLEVVGRGTKSGRPAIHLEGHLRPHPVQVYMYNIPIGADLYDFWIDAERGIMLRVEAKFGGRPILISEVTEIAFDDVRDEQLTFVPPPGAPVRTPDNSRVGSLQVSIEDAARLAPFVVFTPSRVPGAVHMSITFDVGRDAGHGRPAMPASVTVHYRSRQWLLLQQSVMTDEVRAMEKQAGERIVRNGQEMFYSEWEDTHRLALEREGTSVVFSSHFDREALLQIAESLEAASPEPPRLNPA